MPVNFSSTNIIHEKKAVFIFTFMKIREPLDISLDRDIIYKELGTREDASSYVIPLFKFQLRSPRRYRPLTLLTFFRRRLLKMSTNSRGFFSLSLASEAQVSRKRFNEVADGCICEIKSFGEKKATLRCNIIRNFNTLTFTLIIFYVSSGSASSESLGPTICDIYLPKTLRTRPHSADEGE